MFGKSIKSQLTILSLLFLVFVAAVLFQMYFTHKLQYEEILQLQKSHEVISRYLDLEERETKIFRGLRNVIDNRKSTLALPELREISNLNKEWFRKLKLWKVALNRWAEDGNIALEASVFNSNFVDNKERQAKAYSQAIQLCLQRKFDEADHIIKIESAFLPSVQNTIIVILDGIKAQIQSDQAILKGFYLSTALAIMVVLSALVIMSVNIFRNITRSLDGLEQGAKRISEGDFSRTIKIASPVELSRLALSFNEMQSAIKSRDEKIREDAEEIQKLNEVLEQKVVDRNKTIIQQNVALKRKNEELEQVLYAASHDLRTPLISIQGFSEELKMSVNSLVEEVRKGPEADQSVIEDTVKDEVIMALDYIINGSKRMEVLLEGLLRISRMGRESLKIKPLDMNELIKNIINSLGIQINESGTEIEVEKLQRCQADASLFEQVFTNLISNAIKYRSPDRKCVIRIYSEKDDDFIRYFVEDNGQGIPEEYRERVFHAFFRIDEDTVQGDGVGLAVVTRAMDLHNGRAWLEKSSQGKGSTFGLEVPNIPVKTEKTSSAA